MAKNKSNMKKAFSSRQFKMGTYQTIITVILLVVVVFLNLMVTKANIMVDLSSDQKYTLTEDTKTLVKGLKDEVVIYYICQEGNEADLVKKVVDQYKDFGVDVVTKDPVQYPKFTAEYTEDEVADNDVIVVNETNGKSKHVLMADMVPATMDYQTGQQTYEKLDVEGQVTAAIQGITSADAKKLYASKGHDEVALSGSFQDLMTKSNVEVLDTRLDGEKGVPEDCDILVLNGPKYDLSEVEYTAVKTYLEAGGKAMFFLNAEVGDDTLKNYYKLLSDYSISVVNGMVMEDKEHCYNQFVNAVSAGVEEHDITADVGEKETITANTKALLVSADLPSTRTVEPLFSSSENSFSRVSAKESSTEMVDGDIAGPFTLAAAVTDEYRDNTTKILAFGTYYMSDDTFAEDGQYGNRSVMLNSVKWLSGEETSTLAIPYRSLTESKLEVGDGDRVFWIAMLVVILPLALLGYGLFVWYRRRKS